MPAHEVNFDGLVGPTHNYAGLGLGNLASAKNRAAISEPRAAALQGLAKMKFLADLGIPQGVLPPHERPDMQALRHMGFGHGSHDDAHVLAAAARQDPRLLAACCSASSMWAANAATVSPSSDTEDGRVHLTPANLVSQIHRALEPHTTSRVLRTIFADETCFAHHPPLLSAAPFGDEGDANHMRLAATHEEPGIELFVYGRSAVLQSSPDHLPARQSREASEAIARLHGLDEDFALFLQQSSRAIDAGVFHNDVAAVSNENVAILHAAAYAHPEAAREMVSKAFAKRSIAPLYWIEASDAELSLASAVQSYLFNSQLVTLPAGGMAIIAPIEAREVGSAQEFLRRILQSDNPIKAVHYLDVRQSMRNGGGPACLRLRVTLTGAQLQRVHRPVMLDDALFKSLEKWILKHYRETLAPEDLGDPKLLAETRAALDELTRILQLGSAYPFQQT